MTVDDKISKLLLLIKEMEAKQKNAEPALPLNKKARELILEINPNLLQT